ncbi:MAG: hypothetical protein NTZ39_03600 [Methanoregula sp.]|nr:hypothetical protein [Methanoregula sp.]
MVNSRIATIVMAVTASVAVHPPARIPVRTVVPGMRKYTRKTCDGITLCF